MNTWRRRATGRPEGRRGTYAEHWRLAEQEMGAIPALDLTRELLPHFTWPAGEVPPDVAAALEAVAACQHFLWRPERRITFFGGFKAGKSTVLNALTGHNVLPVRANRATGVVTRLAHGPEVRALLCRQRDGYVACEPMALPDSARLAGGGSPAPRRA